MAREATVDRSVTLPDLEWADETGGEDEDLRAADEAASDLAATWARALALGALSPGRLRQAA